MKHLQRCLRFATKKGAKHPIYLDSRDSKSRHFSFLFQRDKLIEVGYNRALPQGNKVSGLRQHSETNAYKKARGVLSRSTDFYVVNIRLGARNEPRMARPCRHCQSFLRRVGCCAVWYSTGTGFEKLSLDS